MSASSVFSITLDWNGVSYTAGSTVSVTLASLYTAGVTLDGALVTGTSNTAATGMAAAGLVMRHRFVLRKK